jgi:hypothetical protein
MADDNVRPENAMSPRQCQRAWDSYRRCLSTARYDEGSKSWYGFDTKEEYCLSKSNRRSYCTAKASGRGGASTSTTGYKGTTRSPSSAVPRATPSEGGSAGGAAGVGAAALAAPLVALARGEEAECDPARAVAAFNLGIPVLFGTVFTVVPGVMPDLGVPSYDYDGPIWGWGHQGIGKDGGALGFRSLLGYRSLSYEGGATQGLASELIFQVGGIRFAFGSSGMRGGDEGVNHDVSSIDLNTFSYMLGFQYGTGLFSPFIDVGYEWEFVENRCRECSDHSLWRIGNTVHLAPLFDSAKGLVIEVSYSRFFAREDPPFPREFERTFFIGLGMESWLFL